MNFGTTIPSEGRMRTIYVFVIRYLPNDRATQGVTLSCGDIKQVFRIGRLLNDSATQGVTLSCGDARFNKLSV